MSRAYRSKAQWQALMDEFEQSGLFCEAQGLIRTTLSHQLQQETESTGFARVAAESTGIDSGHAGARGRRAVSIADVGIAPFYKALSV